MEPFFKELKIIELANVLAGPAVGMFFRELGAEVIKIENKRVSGDVTRSWKNSKEDPSSPSSAYFASVNWNKQHLWLDLQQSSDREQVYQLVAQADIVISNYKAGDAQKLGMDFEQLKKFNPALILGHISGFGPENKRTAYDLVLQAETGFMSMNGTPESGPLKMPVALIDVLAAHQLKEGLLVALIRKMKTGKGALVEVSLKDAAIASLMNQAGNYLMSGITAGLAGSLHPNIAPYGESFETADHRRIVLAIGNNKQFEQLCKVLELPHLITHPQFAENTDRVKNRQLLFEQIDQVIRKGNSGDWLEKFIRLDIPAGLIKNMAEVIQGISPDQILNDIDEHGNTLKRLRNNIFKVIP